MARIRLCVLTAAYPSPSEPTRAVFLKNFLEALAGDSMDLVVVAPRVRREDPKRESQGKILVERFSYPSGNLRLKELKKVSVPLMAAYIASGLQAAVRAIHRTSPHLLYAHWVLPSGFLGALASALTGIPLAVHAHGSDIHRYALSSRLAAGAARWSLGRASVVLAASRDLARRMAERLGVPPRKEIRVVPMGVDTGLFAPGSRERARKALSRKALSLNGERLEILFVGDLDAWKGIFPVTRAILRSVGLRRKVRLHVVGDGPLRPDLEALRGTGEGGMDGALVLHGRLSQNDVALWCRAADLMILPSRGEGSPLAVMEALASGLPVLATAVGGIPELVKDGETGWLARAEDFPARIREIADRRELLLETRRRILESRGDWSASRRAREAAGVLWGATGGLPARAEPCRAEKGEPPS